MCSVCMTCPRRPEEDIALPVTGVTEGCKPLWVLGIGYKFSGSVQLTTEVPALFLLDV